MSIVASAGISVTITRKDLGITAAIAGDIDPSKIAMVAARGARNRIQERFQELENTRPNKKGWPRQHKWSQLRRATQAPAPRGQGSVTVVINDVAAGALWFGAFIRPVDAKLLTIPASPEAYGKRAGEFNDLEIGMARDPDWGNRLRLALIHAQRTDVSFGRKRKDGTRKVKRGKTWGGGVVFWLQQKAHVDADKTILPTPQQMYDAAMQPAKEYIARLTGGSK